MEEDNPDIILELKPTPAEDALKLEKRNRRLYAISTFMGVVGLSACAAIGTSELINDELHWKNWVVYFTALELYLTTRAFRHVVKTSESVGALRQIISGDVIDVSELMSEENNK